MKILTVVGARPQFVKAAVLSKAFRNFASLQEIMVHTGQHYDRNMSDLFFEELEVPKPNHHLGVGSGSPGKQISLMIDRLEAILTTELPDGVLIYGDTNSTLAAAILASKHHFPIIHIEAGMRSFNKRMSEEINRLVADHLSQLLFCSSETAVKNLEKEGLVGRNVGDVMIDALYIFDRYSDQHSQILKTLKLQSKHYYLLTLHRAENTDHLEKLEVILNTFNQLAEEGNKIIFPVHPRTRAASRKLNIGNIAKQFHWIEPISYFDMLQLEKHAKGIFTDSGGVQKEAYFYEIPTLTLRDETEWIETIECGLNRLVPIAQSSIIEAFSKMQEISLNFDQKNIYGRGDASQKIAVHMVEYL